MKNNELYYYGIPGMRWGHRKTQPTTGGSITKNGKYKASNGVVIGKSRNKRVAVARRMSTTAPVRVLAAAGRNKMAKLTGRSKESIKAQEKRERAALKEYYKAGGDKMFKNGSLTPYKKERNRQKKHVVTKNAIRIGSAAVNRYLSAHQVTRNGKAFRVSPMVTKAINTTLDYKYYKDSYK